MTSSLTVLRADLYIESGNYIQFRLMRVSIRKRFLCSGLLEVSARR